MIHTNRRPAEWVLRICIGSIPWLGAVAAGCSSSDTATTSTPDAATAFDANGGGCPVQQTSCGGTCTDTASDGAHCGACGMKCGDGQVCSKGQCALSCGGGTTKCGSTCNDLKLDPANCGACGQACSNGEVCSNGTCASSCGAGLTTCGGGEAGAEASAPYCANTKTDNANCGACGNACPAGTACTHGACGTTCGTGATLCTPDGGASYCAHTLNDGANCGACGNACTGGLVCNAGTCGVSCPGGQVVCNGTCVDPNTDRAHCGATLGCGNDGGSAGTACGAGLVCSTGTCSASCAAPLIVCSNACVDPRGDASHCGNCNTVCGATQSCVNGACTNQLALFPQPSYAAATTFADKLPATSMTITWDGTSYWSSSGGGASGTRVEQYTAAGAPVAGFAPNIDLRSVFTVDGKRTSVYARGYGSNQIRLQTSPGVFGNSVLLTGGTLDSQSAVVFNTGGSELVAFDAGTVSRWNINGAFVGTVVLAAFGSLAGENAYPQNRGIVVASGYYLTYHNTTLTAWGPNGQRLKSTTLTGAGTSFDSYFSVSYANGMVWVIDQAGGTWRGYDVGL